MKSLWIACLLSLIMTHTWAANLNLTKNSPSAEMVLQQLKQGNQRFLTETQQQHNHLLKVYQTANGQYPNAIILSCMDSRSIPELIFDQGIGSIFTLRVAGNIINNDMLASLEYATAVVGTPLIVVLGHTACGAIKGACQHVELGHLTELVHKIKPAMLRAQKEMPKATCDDPRFIDTIAYINVLDVLQQIPSQSPVIHQLMADGKVKLIGAIYDIQNGKVTFVTPLAPASL